MMNEEKQSEGYNIKQLLDELSKMSPMVIATAYLQAVNLVEYGEDVTEKWVTAVQNTSALKKAYRKGYYDAMQRQAESGGGSMTREEKVRNLLTELIDMIDNGSQKDLDRADEISNYIIKIFEQEPCEDCISRQAVLSKIKEVCFSKEWLQFRVNYGSRGQRDFLINYIENLPPVTPTRKIEQESVLNKIRDEIKAMTSNRGFLSCSVGHIHEEIDNVFDKYKAESEEINDRY